MPFLPLIAPSTTISPSFVSKSGPSRMWSLGREQVAWRLETRGWRLAAGGRLHSPSSILTLVRARADSPNEALRPSSPNGLSGTASFAPWYVLPSAPPTLSKPNSHDVPPHTLALDIACESLFGAGAGDSQPAEGLFLLGPGLGLVLELDCGLVWDSRTAGGTYAAPWPRLQGCRITCESLMAGDDKCDWGRGRREKTCPLLIYCQHTLIGRGAGLGAGLGAEKLCMVVHEHRSPRG